MFQKGRIGVQRSKVVQKGPKGTKMASISVFDHWGPFWTNLDLFGPFEAKMKKSQNEHPQTIMVVMLLINADCSHSISGMFS